MSEEKAKKLKEIYAQVEEDKKNIVVHEVGDKGEGTIIDIDNGVVKDFVKEENRKDWKGSIEAPAIHMHIKTPDGNIIKTVMTISGHPNSNMQRWVKRYESYPEINDKIQLRHDGNFWQLN